MRVDIMVDIETLGNKTESTIFQIAAVAFDIKTGKAIATFNKIADIEQNFSNYITGSTLKWWLNTNKELLSDLLNKGKGSSGQLLEDFHSWLTSPDLEGEIYLWGNGILFDNKMIQQQLQDEGLEYPIHYKNDRDVRTIVDLAATKLGISEKELKEKYKNQDLVEHDAYDDVKSQIALVVGCYKELGL